MRVIQLKNKILFHIQYIIKNNNKNSNKDLQIYEHLFKDEAHPRHSYNVGKFECFGLVN